MVIVIMSWREAHSRNVYMCGIGKPPTFGTRVRWLRSSLWAAQWNKKVSNVIWNSLHTYTERIKRSLFIMYWIVTYSWNWKRGRPTRISWIWLHRWCHGDKNWMVGFTLIIMINDILDYAMDLQKIDPITSKRYMESCLYIWSFFVFTE